MIRAAATSLTLILLTPFAASAATDVGAGDEVGQVVVKGDRWAHGLNGGSDTSATGGTNSPTSQPPPITCHLDVPANSICLPLLSNPGEAEEAIDGAPTPGDIERAVRRVGLPKLTIQIQPATRTLVNVDTIFHAEPVEFSRTVDILGESVAIRATPTSYIWHHGDGTSHTTSTPGGSYPNREVSWRYQRPAAELHPSVDVAYRVTFRIGTGPWQTLDTLISSTGPAATLRVAEARSVLVAP